MHYGLWSHGDLPLCWTDSYENITFPQPRLGGGAVRKKERELVVKLGEFIYKLGYASFMLKEQRDKTGNFIFIRAWPSCTENIPTGQWWHDVEFHLYH